MPRECTRSRKRKEVSEDLCFLREQVRKQDLFQRSSSRSWQENGEEPPEMRVIFFLVRSSSSSKSELLERLVLSGRAEDRPRVWRWKRRPYGFDIQNCLWRWPQRSWVRNTMKAFHSSCPLIFFSVLLLPYWKFVNSQSHSSGHLPKRGASSKPSNSFRLLSSEQAKVSRKFL